MRYNRHRYLLRLIPTALAFHDILHSYTLQRTSPSRASALVLASVEKLPYWEKGKQNPSAWLMFQRPSGLPWSMPLGHSAWNLATILSVSAGILEAADESGLIMSVVPGLALNGWEGLVSFDAGAGVGFFSRQKFGEQDFESRFNCPQPWGPASIHFLTPTPAFDSNTSPMPAYTDAPV